jgi:hypothetical protein
MNEIPFTITKEDYENSLKVYDSPYNCPLAVAIKRILNTNDILVGVFEIKEPLFHDVIGTIRPGFEEGHFKQLKNGQPFKGIFYPNSH